MRNAIGRFFTKHTLVSCLAIVLVAVAVCGVIGSRTSGFTKMDTLFDRDLNADNMIKQEAYTDAVKAGYVDGAGITVSPEKDGRIRITGKYIPSDESKTPLKIKVAEIKLDKGTYTFTTGKNGVNKAASLSTAYMSAEVGSESYNADFNNAQFTVAADNTTVTIYINVAVTTGEQDMTFYPTLVAGEKAGAFYA